MGGEEAGNSLDVNSHVCHAQAHKDNRRPQKRIPGNKSGLRLEVLGRNIYVAQNLNLVNLIRPSFGQFRVK